MKSYFITIEGGEGAGKTTLIQTLTQALEAVGHEVVVTREPGGTPVAEAIRKILLLPENKTMTAECELLLYAASRADHCRRVIEPALQQKKMVICDRFTDATLVYQGYARGLSLEWIESLNQFATGGLSPDLTFLLDLPVKVGMARVDARLQARPETAQEGRFDAEAADFHEQVRTGYRTLAKAHPDRIVVLDARATPQAVSQNAMAVLQARGLL